MRASAPFSEPYRRRLSVSLGHQLACALLTLLAILGSPAGAEPLLSTFEAALDERRYAAAGRIVEGLPEGPEKALARAQLATLTGLTQQSYAATDGLNPASLSPPLRAKYLLIRARQEELAARHGPSQEAQARMLRDALASDPTPHDRAELLLLQLWLAREDQSQAEQIIAELFELSVPAGLEARFRTLLWSGRKTEALALGQLVEEQARFRNQAALANEYGMATAFLLLKSGRVAEAVQRLESLLENELEIKEPARVHLTLIYLHWALKERDGRGLSTETYDRTIERLPPGHMALETLWLASRAYPAEARYFQQGLAMARSLNLPLVTSAFLLQRATSESDPTLAAQYRQQARAMLQGLDLRGAGGSWYGEVVASSIYAVGLDTDDDRQIWGRYLELLASGRTEGEISEFWSALLAGVPDRQAAWIWVEPLFESILERTTGWSKRRRAAEVAGALQRLNRPWVTASESGQASTYAPRESTFAAAVGQRLAEQPELLDDLLEGLAEAERADPDPRRASQKLSTLGNLLTVLGRDQEAADLFEAARREPQETRLGELRLLGALARAEHRLELPTAASRYAELAGTNFASDYGPYDQPHRRATELAWWYLEQGRPVEAERLARAALATVPKKTDPLVMRRLGAQEALAFALAEQGRQDQVEALLAQWEQDLGEDGQRWAATLRADLLLRSGDATGAERLLPSPEQESDPAVRIYLADRRRQIAKAAGEEPEVARMEGLIGTSVEQMVSSSPNLRWSLLSSPAYAEMDFLTRTPPPVSTSMVVRGTSEHLEGVVEKLEILRRREPNNEALGMLGGARIRAMIEAASADQVLVHPVLLRHSVLLVVASDGRVSLRERFVDTQTLTETIGRLSALAANPETSLARWSSDSSYITRRLIDPWRSELADKRHLLWLAGGEMERLPLALLQLQGQSLLEGMKVTYLDGPAAVPTFSGPAEALLIGGSDDLAGAAEELREVRRLWPGGESWRLGEDFGKLRTLVQRHRLVHISTHGLPPSTRHAAGQLSSTEGSLSAFRLADLEFTRGSLVVASACEVGSPAATGPGDSTVLSALRTAGAATVLGSLWTIDDQTSRELALSFYKHLLKGEDPSSALALAQLEVRRTHPHPFYWAGPRVLTGPALRQTKPAAERP